MDPRRKAAWAAAGLVLLVPLVAMQLTDEVNWTLSDFVFAGALLFGALGAYELAVRTTGSHSYRAGAGIALAAAVLLLWGNAAAGLTDSTADALYPAVVGIGVVGAFIARFRPRGMAVAMFATAFVHVLVGVVALVAGIVPAHNSPYKLLAITAFFSASFLGSALLFRHAARTHAER